MHFDYGFWYDRHKMTLKEIVNVQYLSAMNPGHPPASPQPRETVRGTVVTPPGKDSDVPVFCGGPRAFGTARPVGA